MQNKLLFLAPLALAFSLPAAAAPTPTVVRHAPPRPAAPPRGKEAGARVVGTHVVPHPDRPMHPTTNPPHQVVYHNAKTNKDENHVVVVDRRPAHVIDHDARIRVVRRGYHSPHNWEHFHQARGGWWHAWGITSWDTVGTVTCEAANETTGELFPVSEDRDEVAWDDTTVNSVLDQALDDCMTEAGGAQCSPATPSCTFQGY
jgi:hypothetical protein